MQSQVHDMNWSRNLGSLQTIWCLPHGTYFFPPWSLVLECSVWWGTDVKQRDESYWEGCAGVMQVHSRGALLT